jgi:hypothetical protein
MSNKQQAITEQLKFLSPTDRIKAIVAVYEGMTTAECIELANLITSLNAIHLANCPMAKPVS